MQALKGILCIYNKIEVANVYYTKSFLLNTHTGNTTLYLQNKISREQKSVDTLSN